MNKIEEAVNEVRIRLQKVKEVFSVVLYGSVSRGDYSIRHSDIDILIISSKNVDSIIHDAEGKFRVKIHAEYQKFPVLPEDQTLLCKMFEEGKVLFSRGIMFMDTTSLGLAAYRLYLYDTAMLDKVQRVMMSRALHTFKVIDTISVINSGRGGLLVRKDKFTEIEEFFNRFKVKYKVVKTVYG
jgi:predicted nucleotidyltransferase